MSYIAMLLPREELVHQAQGLAKEHPSVGEVRCIRTEDAVEEAAQSVRQGAGVIVARGLQAMLISHKLNIPVVTVRMTAQEIGLLLLKAKRICAGARPRVALVVAENMLCDTSCCNILFGVDLKVFTYDTEEGYAAANERAIGWEPDIIVGGETSIEAAQRAGVPSLFIDYFEDSLREAIRSAETALFADERNHRANALFDALLNSTTNGYMQLDSSGAVVKCNDIMLDVMETKSEEILGRMLDEVFPGIEKETVTSVLTDGKNYSTFLHIHYQAMVVILAPIRLPDGRVDGAVFSCHKIQRSMQLDPASGEGDFPQRDMSNRTFENIHHRSAAMAQVIDQAKQFSQSRNPVLLVGEKGLERNLMAQCIHNNSANRTGPFVQVNCAGLSPNSQMAALFGTGEKNEDGEADLGAFGTANNGTLLLLEIEHLSPAVQYNIYRAIRYHRITQTTLERSIHVNVRLIATSENGLYFDMKNGEFREDLYYLLSGLRIDIPPLHERSEDLLDILQENFRRVCESFRRYHVLTNGAWELLRAYAWPGNAIQINSFLERVVLTAQHRTIDELSIRVLLEQMYPEMQQTVQSQPAAPAGSSEAARIMEILDKNGGNRAETAKALGISTTTLWRRMKKLSINGHYGEV